MAFSENLPRLYLVTPEPRAGLPRDAFVEALELTLASGTRLVQLRAKTLPEEDYVLLAQQALACCRRHGALLVLNASVEVVTAVQADGVHLTSSRLMQCAERPLPVEKLLSAACHSADQVRHANAIGVDLMTISPVQPTATHATAQPLGWARFGELASLSSAPVYALGGMTPECLEQARACGSHGIAGIRSLWVGEVEGS